MNCKFWRWAFFTQWILEPKCCGCQCWKEARNNWKAQFSGETCQFVVCKCELQTQWCETWWFHVLTKLVSQGHFSRMIRLEFRSLELCLWCDHFFVFSGNHKIITEKMMFVFAGKWKGNFLVMSWLWVCPILAILVITNESSSLRALVLQHKWCSCCKRVRQGGISHLADNLPHFFSKKSSLVDQTVFASRVPKLTMIKQNALLNLKNFVILASADNSEEENKHSASSSWPKSMKNSEKGHILTSIVIQIHWTTKPKESLQAQPQTIDINVNHGPVIQYNFKRRKFFKNHKLSHKNLKEFFCRI